MNHTFKVKENGFAEIKKGIIKRTLPVAFLASGVGLAIYQFNNNGTSSDIKVFLLTIPIIIIALVFGFSIGIKRQKEVFESYCLSVKDNEITREQSNTQTITIPNYEVTSIIRNAKGIITVNGKSTFDTIIIPAQIENIQPLEQLLSQIQPIIDLDKIPLLEKYWIFYILLVLGLMAAVFVSKNKLVVGLSGTILLIFLGYSFYSMKKNKNIDNRTKKGMWGLIIVVLSVIGNMYLKLTGML